MAVQQSTAPAPLPSLGQIVRRIQEISTLPQVALRVMQVANNPNAGARELKEVIEFDPALCTRILRCVNSSAYATRVKITNLQQAIAYLGIRQIRNLALTASISNLFRQPGAIGPYQRTGLWRHLVAVGICSRLIAMRCRLANFEDMFLGGLLHDIGTILEDEHLHEPFAQMILSLQPGASLIEAERQYLGFDHTVLAEAVTKMWNFPENVLAAVRYHHGSAGYRGPQIEVVRCVELSNFICTLKGLSSVGLNLVQFPRAAIEGMSLTKDDLAVLAADLDRELKANEGLFQL
ncbi:MAG: HDOD domain-containing protein [Thermoguttaceae bacterium]